ncbi:MAG: hypothetical protein B6I36_01995 [Desulfobacteraceae bacterium 4572_35.1]|nr:MAG: hypothetical protein B6I36_01995 [Desulfobacteraceae bacterium 4572_35.1]
MQPLIRFFMWTLVLSFGVFVAMAIPHLQGTNRVLWFLSTFFIGAGIALVGKKCGRGALLLAIPISVLLANEVVVYVWPPQVQRNIFHAFNKIAKRDDVYQQLRQQLLPVAWQTLHVPPELQQGWDAGEQKLAIANGVQVNLFSTGLIKPHSVIVDDKGVVFVSLPVLGQVISIHDDDSDHIGEKIVVFASGLKQPSGMVFKDSELWVATATKLLTMADDNHDYVADSIKVVNDKLPQLKYNKFHALAVGQDNHVYISVGSDAGDSGWQQASVLRLQDDDELHPFATGIYDCQGLAVHPKSGSLWCSENGPETIGYFVHPDELNVLRAQGDYGWPFCYGDRLPDAKLGSTEICQATQPALMKLPAHSTPRGLTFGADLRAPQLFKAMLYLVLQGNMSRKSQQGFRLMGVPLDDEGRITGWGIDLVSGWSGDGQPWGQPTDCVVGKDGCLYLTDKLAGAVYRISFEAGDNEFL